MLKDKNQHFMKPLALEQLLGLVVNCQCPISHNSQRHKTELLKLEKNHVLTTETAFKGDFLVHCKFMRRSTAADLIMPFEKETL